MTAREQAAYHLATLLKKARRQMTVAIKAELEPTGACLPAIQLLKRATAGDDLSQLELSHEIELEPAALSRLVADLEQDGLVVRRRDPRDKRRVLIEATPKGVALLDQARPLVMSGVRTMASRLSQDEQRELCRLLEKLSRDEGENKPANAARAPGGARAGAKAPGSGVRSSKTDPGAPRVRRRPT